MIREKTEQSNMISHEMNAFDDTSEKMKLVKQGVIMGSISESNSTSEACDGRNMSGNTNEKPALRLVSYEGECMGIRL